jgi:hypothetical protein
MMDNGVTIPVRTMMRGPPLRRPRMVMMAVMVLVTVRMVVGRTVRHQHSRADRTLPGGSITGADLNLSWLIFGK